MADSKKVLSNDVLRKEPRFASDTLLSPDGEDLQVQAGEVVNIGAKPSQDEVLPNRTITWVFVEATAGQFKDLRKGFISSGNLGGTETSVPRGEALEVFHEEVDRGEFAITCYFQATLNETNPAYLYALAFALSGDQWGATTVKTSDPAGATAFGAFRFPTATWQRLISEPEATDILPDDIKFPEIQCIVAAILAAKSANLLASAITDRGVSAVDLFLAHLFADSKGFGSDAAAAILQAEKDNKTQSSETVIKTIYPDGAVRTAFFNRNANIFKADGSATIEQALAVCATKLDSGFDVVRKLADDIEADVFDNIPSQSTGPILSPVADDGGGAGTVTGAKNGIDRRQFLGELKNPAILKKSADMVKGEVGWNAPQDTKLVQLETAFNRAMARGHSVAQALLSVSEDPRRGYYAGGANGTYSRPVTPAEFEDFKKTILPALLAGSNKSQELLGFIATGNASPPVSTAQFAKGTQGGNLPSGLPGHPESYFHEPPFKFPFKLLQGGESMPLPGGASSPGLNGPPGSGEPPEHMDGDTEGSGPSGGKFNVKANTPIAPSADHQIITLSNGVKVDVGKRVAEQFRGFLNDLIKSGAPVRDLGGFGVRPGNPSEHPIGFAIDWAQTSRDVVATDVRKWIDSHRDLLKKLENRWGLSGGENWHNPDTGHFSVERILGEQHLKASRDASARG
jgi:hypothetical protein